MAKETEEEIKTNVLATQQKIDDGRKKNLTNNKSFLWDMTQIKVNFQGV